MKDELEGHCVTLPSGLVAQLQRPDPLWYQSHQAEIELMNGTGPTGDLSQLDGPEVDWLMAFVGEFLREMFIDPKLPDGSYPELDLADAVYLFIWCGDQTPPDGCAQRVM